MENIYLSKDLKDAEKSYCGIKLMEKAAQGIISHIKRHLNGEKLTIVCGSGNNGGDGWAVASLLKDYPLEVVFICDPKTTEGKFYKEKFKGTSIPANANEAKETILNAKIILDCIFGIGLSRSAEGLYKDCISWINESNAYVVSVDLPSGLTADESYNFHHVNADSTICITSKKLSGVITPTKEAYGEIYVHTIDVDMENFSPMAKVIGDEILKFLPYRPRNSHKGVFGTLKTLCGSENMTGAGVLSITAALRSGVGLVKAFGNEKLLNVYKCQIPEPIYKYFFKEAFINEPSSALLIGCGIGREYDEHLRDILTNSSCPIILDADGINFLSENIDICEHIPTSLILTPHPKEMARLCNCSLSQVNENRFSICKETSEKLNCTVVLKGEGTIICTPDFTPLINETGNSGLSKGGSGDVLAGMIGSFVAQGVSPHYAAAISVYLHGLAADSLKEKFSEFSFLPSDIPMEVGRILANKLR